MSSPPTASGTAGPPDGPAGPSASEPPAEVPETAAAPPRRSFRAATPEERLAILEDARMAVWEKSTDPKYVRSMRKLLAAMGIESRRPFRQPKRRKRSARPVLRPRRLGDPLGAVFIKREE